MIFGYCRISRKSQKIERQEANILAAYPSAQIHKEAYTGTTTDRPVWNRLHKLLRTGDTLVFDSVSRMSRNAADGIALYEQLYNAGIELVFLKEPYCDTEVYRRAAAQSIPLTGHQIADEFIQATNRVLLLLAKEQITIAFNQSEKEVSDLRQRTKEGIEMAHRRGKQSGRKLGAIIETKKAQTAKKMILKHSKTFGGTLNDIECRKLIGCSSNSFYKYKKQLKAQLSEKAVQ